MLSRMIWKLSILVAAFRRFAILAPVFAVVVLSHGNAGAQTKSPAKHDEGYLGSEACARCHAGIYQTFSKTAMGRSMSIAAPDALDHAPSPFTFTNDRLNRKFEVSLKDRKIYQSEDGLGADNSFHDEHPMAWVIGAGVNGFGLILRRENYLFQAPLSFYTKPATWGPSPGYESVDLGFNRSIQPGCIFCHSGRPNSVASSNGKFDEPPFSELAIGCERCHGPGAAHVQSMHASHSDPMMKPASISSPGSIVNPGRLTPKLADNICMACHQSGDMRVLKPGKTYSDVRPGQPLDDTLSILMIPPTREAPPSDDHVQHYYSMTLSKCYRESAGRMSCITCHDPHVQPTAAEAPAYFAAKCMTCHTNQSCKLPLAARQKTQPANNCIGCHMPKRDIAVISHSSATNHRIVATPEEPFPDVAFQSSKSQPADLMLVNPAPGKEGAPLQPLTLLQAYGELAENKPDYTASYLRVLELLEKSQPDVAIVQASLGRRDLKSGDFASAVQHLRRASELDPEVATTYADLGDALAHQGQPNEAIPWIEKAIELDPFNPISRKMLVVRLIETKQFSRAHQALQEYLAIFPQDDFMRQMLARAEGKPSKP